jgi:hypothetical protein
MTGHKEHTELRYLVQAGKELGDDVKYEIVSEMIEEGDMCVTISRLYDDVDSSGRTIRRHINESGLIERKGSQGVVLVDVIDDLSEKALRVAHSSDKATEKDGLPKGDIYA